METNQEQWLPVVGYEGLYEVSDNGNVRSLDRTVTVTRHNGTYIKPVPGILISQRAQNGYKVVRLSKCGAPDTKYVHRLVAEAFVPNPNNLETVDHIVEGNKHDNRASNLSWLGRGDNARKGNYEKPTTLRNRTTEEVRSFPSLSEAARQLKLNIGHLGQVSLGKRKSVSDWICA